MNEAVTMGKRKLAEVLDELTKQGKEPSEEQLKELEPLSTEIDQLYNLMIENQRQMGLNPLKVKP